MSDARSAVDFALMAYVALRFVLRMAYDYGRRRELRRLGPVTPNGCSWCGTPGCLDCARSAGRARKRADLGPEWWRSVRGDSGQRTIPIHFYPPPGV